MMVLPHASVHSSHNITNHIPHITQAMSDRAGTQHARTAPPFESCPRQPPGSRPLALYHICWRPPGIGVPCTAAIATPEGTGLPCATGTAVVTCAGRVEAPCAMGMAIATGTPTFAPRASITPLDIISIARRRLCRMMEVIAAAVQSKIPRGRSKRNPANASSSWL
mmetsp:Transcript_29100/g.66857  ORF Transcript_29100/g.66857 Transcript_29100/m.66857 type:complete len:166 (-) Transcript_29100:392-889(-)